MGIDGGSKEEASKPEYKFDERVVSVTGDITDIEADAVVCPSLPDLDVLYTGVAGAIMRKGGPKIFAEARAIGVDAKRRNPESEFPVPLQSAFLTTAGELPKAKHVIHSVAVDFKNDELTCNPLVIYESALNVLKVADSNGLASVAFPALGSGLYEVPQEQSFGAISHAATRFLQENPNTTVQKVLLVSRDPNIPKPSIIDELTSDFLVRSTRNRLN